MDFSRRELLGLVAVSALAGCSSGDDGDSGDGPTETTGTPPATADGSAGTSLAGSCASNFGDTLQPYDVGDRGMVAAFGYPMGGEVTSEQDEDDSHVTGFGYGRGDVSPLHTMTVSETGPTGEPADATEAYSFDDRFESGTVTTYDGRERPVAIRRADESVTYIVHVERSDGVYVFSVQTSAGEGEPCPDVYESVTRRVTGSFEPVA
ncbi:hypothetical protein [Haloarcula onubensis]|uniref:Lipoprotein n=1 Tax=Haloarcula onubensis TaxID=2950539 RepID=A0ABU2FQD6_9EURY|nr:hypothetical protein [Halomicroarcula sp. S3CR25-11]MDS0282472.1 hypothetical protein [Halomicroarcula sp. S3CR25-11]